MSNVNNVSRWLQTYQFQHFLPFSRETYYRIFEQLNSDDWAIPLLFFGGILFSFLFSNKEKVLLPLNALSWGSVGYFFFYSSLSNLLPFSGIFLTLFCLSGLGLFFLGFFQTDPIRKWGGLISILTLLGVPLVELIFGMKMKHLSFVGLAPLATIIWSLGLGVTFSSWKRVLVVSLSAGWGLLFLLLRVSLR